MMFKQTILAVSALAATTMIAGAADMPAKAPRLVEQPQQVSGYVELYGGAGRLKLVDTFCDPGCDVDELRVNGWSLGGAGRVNWWWAPNYSIQLDAQGEGTSYKFTGPGFFSRSSSHAYLIGGHANWRDPQRGLIGVFGGAGDATNFFVDTVRHGLVGVEGQAYWGPVTLYGQGGYSSTIFDVSIFVDNVHAWFVRGTGRVYVNANFRLEGTVLYADGSVDFGPNAGPGTTDFQTWLWRAKAEYKFASAPFSLFAYYEGSRLDTDRVGPGFTANVKVTDQRVMGGIRLYLNENTLQWNDRNGTTLDIISPFTVPAMLFGLGPA
jgi:hypothetical protein